MKTKILSLLSIVFLSSTSVLFAQNQNNKTETIIIDNGKNSNETTFEIKNGEVLLDGKKVASIDGKTNLKIVKKNGDNKEEEINNDGQKEENNIGMEAPDQNIKSNKALMGVNLQPTKENNGAQIAEVKLNSPAEKAGLQQGDIITKIDNEKINNPKDVVSIVAKHQPDDKIKIVFTRKDELRNASVTLGKNEQPQMRMYEGDPKEMFKSFGGFDELMNNINGKNGSNAPMPKIGIEAEDRADGDGVIVNNIATKSTAEKAGLQKGDIITKYGNRVISSVDDLSNAIAQNASQKTINIEVKRNRKTENIQLEIPKILKKKDF